MYCLENLVYHFFRQLWLVLGVKLMEINSNWFSRWLFNRDPRHPLNNQIQKTSHLFPRQHVFSRLKRGFFLFVLCEGMAPLTPFEKSCFGSQEENLVSFFSEGRKKKRGAKVNGGLLPWKTKILNPKMEVCFR